MIQANELRIFGYIYKITNLVNGKLYFGITRCTIQKRWNEHKHNSVQKKRKSFLNNAIHKYGPNNFKIEKIKTCFSADQMYNGEKYFIRTYKTNDSRFGYNNSIGGEQSSLGKRLSKEAKLKISQARVGKKRQPLPESVKLKIRNAALGRDTSKAIVASVLKRKGTHLNSEYRERISKSMKGIGNTPILRLSKDNVLLNEYKSVSIAAKENNILQTAISNVLTNRAKTAGGFKWQYKQMS